jgi:hypothetical protein
MHPIILICLTALLLSSADCIRREKPLSSPLSRWELQAVSSAKKVDDIFEKACDIQLETNTACTIASISDMDIDAKENFVIADGWQLGQVYLFARDGQFIKILGKRGQGPGEYSTPVSVGLNSRGEILISDYLRNQIIVYSPDYVYRESIPGKPRIYYFVHLNRKDEIYMYSGTVGPLHREAFDTIHKLNEKGIEILAFAPVPRNVLDMDFSVVYDGMAIDRDDFIYEMNPLYYQIRKYTADGKLIRSFSNPNSKNKMRKGGSAKILNGPYYLEKGLLIVQREDCLDIFDTEGNFIVGKIPLAQKIVNARRNALYLEEWEMPGPEKTQLNPKIICYELRNFMEYQNAKH